MRSTLEASSEQIDEVRAILESSTPPGIMIEHIIEQTRDPNHTVWSAIHNLLLKGVNLVEGNPFGVRTNRSRDSS